MRLLWVHRSSEHAGHTFIFYNDYEKPTEEGAFGFKENYQQPDADAAKLVCLVPRLAKKAAAGGAVTIPFLRL